MRYGIVIDLKKCFGCHACSIICKQKNGTPPGVFWARVYITETGEYPNARRENLPALCMHCDNPACVDVCPTRASYKREDGIVLIDQDKCIGCRNCITACPYNARFFDSGESRDYFAGKGPTAYEKTKTKVTRKGKVSKCTMCVERVKAGEPPACVQVCPSKARLFGDLDDPESEVSKSVLKGARRLHPELGTGPSVYYLPQ